VIKKYKVDRKGLTTCTLNQLFFSDTEKQKFFYMAKKKNLDPIDEQDLDKKAMREYYDNC
jgi:hypothetical protein